MIDAVIASRGSITIVGFIFLLWGALGFFGAVTGASTAPSATASAVHPAREAAGILLILSAAA